MLEEILTTGTFGFSQQGKEICTMLEIGVIPEAVEQFRVWLAKFQERVQTLELQAKKHLATLSYAELASDYDLFVGLQQFNSSFLISGHQEFTTISSRVTEATNSIVEKMKSDWKKYYEEFLVLLASVGQQNTTSPDRLKANLMDLIEKLKVICIYKPFSN